MKRFAPLLLLLALFVIPGCLDVQLGLDLKEDQSGTAKMDFKIDMGAMAYVSAAMSRAFEGKEGPPTAEEIEAARQELMATDEDEEPFDVARAKQEAASDLPDGVRLADLTYQHDGLKTAYGVTFTFDHIDRMKELNLNQDAEADPEAAGGPASALEKPFSGLRLIDEGDAWLLTTPPLDPVADAESQAEGAPGLEGIDEMLKKVFEGLRIAFTVTVPTEIIAHNATRVEGRTLIWEWTYDKLEAMRGQPEEAAMFVRYKK